MKRLTVFATLAALLLLPLFAMAATNHATVRIYDPVQVAGTMLRPGRYRVDWTGTGPSVRVVFDHDGRRIMSTPATLKMKHNPYHQALVTDKVNNQRVLAAIEFRHETLRFRKKATASQ
jgi:hypothetical protein